MPTILQAIVLGIVQGITEWLPISSSGHVEIFQHFFRLKQPLAFHILLHFGSLIVIFVVFAKDIRNIVKGLFRGESESQKLLLYIAVGSIPAALAGLLLKDQIEAVFHTLTTVGLSLTFTGALLLLSKYPRKKERGLTLRNTFLIGIAQSVALLPGVSRSGATISTGLLQSVRREEAARFSFLLVLPAILGAIVLDFREVSELKNHTALFAGTAATIVTGTISLKLLLRLINKGYFNLFAWYCLPLGAAILLFELAKSIL